MGTTPRARSLALLLIVTSSLVALVPDQASAYDRWGRKPNERAGFGLLGGVQWRTHIMLDIDVPNTWSGYFGVAYMWEVADSIVIGAFAALDVNYTRVKVSNRDDDGYSSWDHGDECDRGEDGNWDALGIGVQLGGRALFYPSPSFAFYLSPVIHIWDVRGAIGCEDHTYLGDEDVYSLSELAAEVGIVFQGEQTAWEISLLHVGYNPDVGATGPFYPGLTVRSTF